jgi:hypothetical protein
MQAKEYDPSGVADGATSLWLTWNLLQQCP